MSKAQQMAARPSTKYRVECVDKDGRVKWSVEETNLVVDAGLNDLIDKYFKGSTYDAAHFIGLVDASPTIAAGDTMAAHAGWSEIVGYSQATRPAFTPGAVAGGAADNSGNVAAFSINASATIGGLFLVTDQTKGGAAGTLYGVAPFTGGDKAVDDGDTLNVTCTVSVTAS